MQEIHSWKYVSTDIINLTLYVGLNIRPFHWFIICIIHTLSICDRYAPCVLMLLFQSDGTVIHAWITTYAQIATLLPLFNILTILPQWGSALFNHHYISQYFQNSKVKLSKEKVQNLASQLKKSLKKNVNNSKFKRNEG